MVRKKNKLVYGIGINDADYQVQISGVVNGKKTKVWVCPFYYRWTRMLSRVSQKWIELHPSYKDCSVCDEWLTFSNFKSWMEQQDWEGKHLDKDLLVEGNKIYSPDTCIFVDKKINLFVVDNARCRGNYMVGVTLPKQSKRYMSKCSNPFTGIDEYLGYFNTELEAHLAWKKRKHEHACQLAESELVSDPRLAEALKVRYV